MSDSPSTETEECYCTAIRKASRRISLAYDNALAGTGLKVSQYSILAELERRSAAPPTMNILALALGMDRSTLGQNLRPLQREKLLTLTASASDRRRKHVTLTTKGCRKIAEAKISWKTAQTKFEKGIGSHAAMDLRTRLNGIVTL